MSYAWRYDLIKYDEISKFISDVEDIYAEEDYVGGIVGHSIVSNAEIKYCFNRGTLTNYSANKTGSAQPTNDVQFENILLPILVTLEGIVISGNALHP